jgi:hypothetical protein
MGDPAVEVLQAAKRLHANLIVMATHGRKGLRRLVLGSVAENGRPGSGESITEAASEKAAGNERPLSQISIER